MYLGTGLMWAHAFALENHGVSSCMQSRKSGLVHRYWDIRISHLRSHNGRLLDADFVLGDIIIIGATNPEILLSSAKNETELTL